MTTENKKAISAGLDLVPLDQVVHPEVIVWGGEYDARLDESEDGCKLDCGCSMWRDGEDICFKYCAAHDALGGIVADCAADKIGDLAKAHHALSEALEDEDAGNDVVRDAALEVCAALNRLQERARKALGMPA